MRNLSVLWLAVTVGVPGFSAPAAATTAFHHHHDDDAGDGDSSGDDGDSSGDDGDSSGDDGDSGSANVGVLPSFAGIWVADGDEATKLDPGCHLLVRVSADPKQLLRAIICADGHLETSQAAVTGIVVEPSRFAGGFQLRTKLAETQTSCTADQTSRFAALASVAFDLKTGAGGEAATFAYTQFGDMEVALHSGASLDVFERNKDCPSIAKLAKGLADSTDTPEAQLLRLAAKVCNIEAQQAGCFTAGGYSAPSTP